jgi:hypothetical protein
LKRANDVFHPVLEPTMIVFPPSEMSREPLANLRRLPTGPIAGEEIAVEIERNEREGLLLLFLELLFLLEGLAISLSTHQKRRRPENM